MKCAFHLLIVFAATTVYAAVPFYDRRDVSKLQQLMSRT